MDVVTLACQRCHFHVKLFDFFFPGSIFWTIILSQPPKKIEKWNPTKMLSESLSIFLWFPRVPTYTFHPPSTPRRRICVEILRLAKCATPPEGLALSSGRRITMQPDFVLIRNEVILGCLFFPALKKMGARWSQNRWGIVRNDGLWVFFAPGLNGIVVTSIGILKYLWNPMNHTVMEQVTWLTWGCWRRLFTEFTESTGTSFFFCPLEQSF